MRTLVTGAAGFLGRHLMDRLADTGIEAIGLDDRIGNLADSPHKLILTDLRGPLPDVGADVIYSLAAIADPQAALAQPVACYANDIMVIANTIEHAKRCGARMIHISTNEAAEAHGPYAAAKACQELVCRAQDDVRVLIATTQSLFGEWQQGHKLVPTAIRCLIERKPVPLQHNDGTFAIRPWIHVGVVASALARLATDEYPASNISLGSLDPTSNLKMVELIADRLGVEPTVRPIPAGDRPGHEFAPEPIGGLSVSQERFEAEVAATVDWYVANG